MRRESQEAYIKAQKSTENQEVLKVINAALLKNSPDKERISIDEAKEILSKYKALKEPIFAISKEKLKDLAIAVGMNSNQKTYFEVINALRDRARTHELTPSEVAHIVGDNPVSPLNGASISAYPNKDPLVCKADDSLWRGEEGVRKPAKAATRPLDEKKLVPMAMSGRQDEKLIDSKYSSSDISSTDNEKKLSAKLHYISDIDSDNKTEVLNDNHWYGKDGQTDIYGEAQLLNLIKDFNEAELDTFIQRFTGEYPDWAIGGNRTRKMHKKFHENFSIKANEVAMVGAMISPKGGGAGLNALVQNNVEQYYNELTINKEDIPAIQARLETLQKQNPSLFEKTMGLLATIGVGVRNFPFFGMLAGVAGERQSLQVMRTTDKKGKEQIGVNGKQPFYKDFNIGSASLTVKARLVEAVVGVYTGAEGQNVINNTESFIKNMDEKIPSSGIVDALTIGTLSPAETSLVEAYNKNTSNIGPEGKNILIEALANMHMVEMAQKNPDWHFKGVEAGISFWNLLRGSPPFFLGIFFEKLETAGTANNMSNANAVVESGANAKKTSLEAISITIDATIDGGNNKQFTTQIPFPAEGTPFHTQLTEMGATLANVNGKLIITVPKDTYLAFGKREVVTSETVSTFYTIQEAKPSSQAGGAPQLIGKPIESAPYIVHQQQDTLGRKEILQDFKHLGDALYLARRHDFGGKDNNEWDKKHEPMYKQFDTFFQCVGDEQYQDAIKILATIKNPHAKNLRKLVDAAKTDDAKRSILVSALSFTYGGKHTRVLDKVNDVNDVIHDYTQKLSAEAKLWKGAQNETSRAFFTNALKGLKKGGTLPTKQLSDIPKFKDRIIGSTMCATPLGGEHHLDALPGSSEVFDPIWIDGTNGTMSEERKKAILEKSTTTIALGVSEMNKFLSDPKGVFAGKELKITDPEYRTLLLDNKLPDRFIAAGVKVKDPAIFFDAIACIQGSKCLNDQGGVVHTTIQGAPPPVVSPVDDIASIGTGATVGTKGVTVWAFDPSLMAKAANNTAGAVAGQGPGVANTGGVAAQANAATVVLGR